METEHRRLKSLLLATPWALVGLRLALGPTVVLFAWHGIQGLPMALAVLAALASDVYDGIIARKVGVATVALRRADSIVDTIFYLAAAWSAWLVAPFVVKSVAKLLISLGVLEISRYIFDYLKFRREASYHSYLAKVWGLVLAAALIMLLAFNISGWLLRTALWLGIVSDIEGLAISLLLPDWAHDVRSVLHAHRLRKATAN